MESHGRRKTLLAFLLLLGLGGILCGETRANSSAHLKDLRKLEGMYWHNFSNGLVDGTKYESTNVLELVRYDKDSLYFRASLQFYNGHSCSIYGIAERNGAQLTYYDTTYGNGCVLHVVPTSKGISLDDPTGQCRAMSCGERGGYGGENFSPKHKKKITYMARLKSSTQYQKAVVDYERVKTAKAHGIAPQWSNAKAMLGTYAFWGNVEGVRQALIQGADFEVNDGQRWGPVSGAGYRRDIEITQLMLDHGMDINRVENGKTLLANASCNDPGQPNGDQQFAYIKWLLEKGANPDIPDSDGERPVDIAVRTKADQRIVELLKTKTER
ncbi:ankyrin repeat domain-containing protein [Mesorhizobium sp. J8]|uniref:ankyrin repeat domain-containing protein n=1 Tax=Mesorhizobium sp. J8 TaxID=2777475 RepID=UPI001915B584|nr:ankyrin repeat domain-containing protein [Mesorhizobium sp. J8]BCM21215.1 hypothetical protein MJ8_50070 [Mesorhizobium sp. J8]